MNLPSQMREDPAPAIWSPRGVSGVAIAPASVLGPVPFIFPHGRRVVGVLLIPRSGDPADAANLNLRIEDEDANDVIDDTHGTTVVVPALALVGRELARVFRLDRAARGGARWNITISNVSAAVTITPLLHFYLGDRI